MEIVSTGNQGTVFSPISSRSPVTLRKPLIAKSQLSFVRCRAGICVPTPKFHMLKPTAPGRQAGLWVVIRSRGWNPHEPD